MKETLLRLFEDCLKQSYREVENAASYAYRRKKQKDGHEHLYIFFQQSHGVVDWLNNLDFAASPYTEMNPEWKCHTGFLKVWESAKKYLKPHLFDPNIAKVTVVGYSHGAALAVLCHEYIWYRRPDLRNSLEGFGYGCPRVLYGCVPPEIALRWEHFYVIRNENDLITHLPPHFAGYCHVGNLISIGERKQYSGIDAHRPENYLKELKKMQ